MNVSAIIVTRGDVDLTPILWTLPPEWQKLVWDNGAGKIREWSWDQNVFAPHWNEDVSDLSVYGRYAAIQYASHDLIYVQDDDVIVSDPAAIVDAWLEVEAINQGEHSEDPTHFVVCNMPQEFRHDFYTDHALVGFGAAFHRDAPKRAFDRWYAAEKEPGANGEWGLISRTCDVIFTALTPRDLVDVPKENLPHAYADNRMWKQKQHQYEREAMLALALKAKETL